MQNSFILRFAAFSDYDVTIIFTSDIKAVAKSHKARASKNTAACFITKRVAPLSGWLVFNRNPSANEIAHEAWHCIFHLMSAVGAKLEDEVVAYHLGYLVGEIHKFKERL